MGSIEGWDPVEQQGDTNSGRTKPESVENQPDMTMSTVFAASQLEPDDQDDGLASSQGYQLLIPIQSGDTSTPDDLQRSCWATIARTAPKFSKNASQSS